MAKLNSDDDGALFGNFMDEDVEVCDMPIFSNMTLEESY